MDWEARRLIIYRVLAIQAFVQIFVETFSSFTGCTTVLVLRNLMCMNIYTIKTIQNEQTLQYKFKFCTKFFGHRSDNTLPAQCISDLMHHSFRTSTTVTEFKVGFEL